MSALELLVTASGGLLAGVFADRLASHRNRAQQREVRQREAGERLLPPLRELRDLFRRSQHSVLGSEAWAAAIIALAAADDDVSHRLPRGWGHLLRSVRAAAGEFVGAPSLADIDERMRAAAVAPHDERWRQYGLDFLDHVIYSVQTWTDEPTGREVAQRRLDTFDEWLALTGRHGTAVRRNPRRWRVLRPQAATGL